MAISARKPFISEGNMNYKTEQEEFWSGSFGNDYIQRNESPSYLASNIAFFSKIFKNTSNLTSIIELGANIGMNLKAIHSLLPNCKLAGVEINKLAYEELDQLDYVEAIHGSLLEANNLPTSQLALIKGVLIHLNPDALSKAYEMLYKYSTQYILIAEYYNPSPVSISYRGHSDKLFKRDFAGEIMEKYPNLRLLDYGFTYHKDPNFPQDDITWFLLEKSSH